MAENLTLQNAARTADEPVTAYVEIAQGDRTSRFLLRGANGSPVVLANDLYVNHFLAEPIRKAMAEVNKQHQRFEMEAQSLCQIVEDWKSEHKDTINLIDTKIAKTVLVSTIGKARFQFIVVPLEGQEDFLESELVKLDSRILKDSTFQMVRLDSVLM
jgi:hypothetical protein